MNARALRFAEKTPRANAMSVMSVRRGVHRSVMELEAARLSYATRHNDIAIPFRWTKNAGEILLSVKRCCLHTANSRH